VRTEPVDSSVIAEIGYDPETRILEVRFHGGRVYHYFGVPRAEHAALMSADSIGGYFNRTIFPRYRWTRIDAE
jgi:KTSC domain